jgi:glycosyltransferase involved in cell wall biosynthesis
VAGSTRQTSEAAGLPDLTVAFSTRGLRALGLRPGAWPSAPGLDYLVLAQKAESDPRIAPHLGALARGRDDVTVVRLASSGLARSRNAALELARGDVLLLADDDVRHLPGAFNAIRRYFRDRPASSLLVGQSLDAEGAPRRRPLSPRPLTLFNAGRAASHELALRREAVLAAGVRFDEGFGAGAGTANFLGEEYIFIADCLRAGLAGEHRPLPVTVHPGPSSGAAWAGPEAARARAAVIARVFRRRAPLARLGYALKNARRFASARDLVTFLRG